MRALVQCTVEVAAPAQVVWRYVTDWGRQHEWVPLTRVEPVGAAAGTGGRFRAWTGLGPVGFWDTMTITGWDEGEDGSASCEVLHTGRVVRGEGSFTVAARGPDRCSFTLAERVEVPGGPIGALVWKLAAPLVQAGARRTLRAMAARVEAGAPAG